MTLAPNRELKVQQSIDLLIHPVVKFNTNALELVRCPSASEGEDEGKFSCNRVVCCACCLHPVAI